mgnify:CR=1 FL=1
MLKRAEWRATEIGVFHSAGVAGVTPIRQISEQFLQHVFHSNYFAPILLTQRLLAKAAVQKGGSGASFTVTVTATGQGAVSDRKSVV